MQQCAEPLPNAVSATEFSDVMLHLDEITASVSAGKGDEKAAECILFLGAGVHFPPKAAIGEPPSPWTYPEIQRPPLGRALAERLAAKCQLLKDYPDEAANLSNLARVSQFFEKKRLRSALVDEVICAVDREEVAGKIRQTKPSPAVRGLAELPFTLIITTNYDHLFERALRQVGKEPLIGIYDPKASKPTMDYRRKLDPARPFLYKLHGDIDDRDSLVITDEDYIKFILRMSDRDNYHPVPELFRTQFKRWPTLFIGYSLLDYNLRLLFKTLRWKVDEADYPANYSVGPSPDPLIQHLFGTGENPYVWFVVEDLWRFVPALYRNVLKREMPN